MKVSELRRLLGMLGFGPGDDRMCEAFSAVREKAAELRATAKPSAATSESNTTYSGAPGSPSASASSTTAP
ncbi:hypothetical protein ABT269_21560 [Streptomyces viridosporus]|uniref:hypothetical protein n=1 Tax=Streptomyces viridosporus TaxID=67581 RepID=UPI00331CE802